MGDDTLDTTQMIESADDFETVYRSHAHLITRFLFWRTNDSDLSEDLTSRVFEKAWRSRSSFSGGSVKAWLYTIARNVLTDHWRKKKDIPSDDIDSLAEGAPDVAAATQLDQVQQLLELRQAVNKLPKNMKTVVELRFINGLSSKQVAQRLNMTDSNVRIIQYRALKRLRGYLS